MSPLTTVRSDERPHPTLPPVTNRPGHSWEPASPCAPSCLPAPDTLPSVGRARIYCRLAGLISLVLLYVLVALSLPLVPARGRPLLVRSVFRAVLRAIGVRLVHRGGGFGVDRGAERDADQAATGVLVVANHLSWLDIIGLGAVEPMRMVAKREIRDWPVLGGVAVRVGTLFVDRAGLRSLPMVVADAAEALRGGGVVGLFPEGTTWCGAAAGEFRRAGFQAALDAGVPVRPVAQRMLLPDGTPTTVGAFIGEDTLLDSLKRVLSLPSMVLEVQVLPMLVAEPGTDRRELARRAELAIAEATGVPAAAARELPGRRRVPDAA
jgi:1-acyl-sn-glycerol-3-phosphate acyltransferase